MATVKSIVADGAISANDCLVFGSDYLNDPATENSGRHAAPSSTLNSDDFFGVCPEAVADTDEYDYAVVEGDVTVNCIGAVNKGDEMVISGTAGNVTSASLVTTGEARNVVGISQTTSATTTTKQIVMNIQKYTTQVPKISTVETVTGTTSSAIDGVTIVNISSDSTITLGDGTFNGETKMFYRQDTNVNIATIRVTNHVLGSNEDFASVAQDCSNSALVFVWLDALSAWKTTLNTWGDASTSTGHSSFVIMDKDRSIDNTGQNLLWQTTNGRLGILENPDATLHVEGSLVLKSQNDATVTITPDNDDPSIYFLDHTGNQTFNLIDVSAGGSQGYYYKIVHAGTGGTKTITTQNTENIYIGTTALASDQFLLYNPGDWVEIICEGSTYRITGWGRASEDYAIDVRSPESGIDPMRLQDSSGSDILKVVETGDVTTSNNIIIEATATDPATSGEIRNSSDTKMLETFTNATAGIIPKVIYIQNDTVTVSNSSTETTVLGSAAYGSLTLPANFFSAGKTLIWEMHGTTEHNSGNVRIEFMFGSTEIGEFFFTPAAQTAPRPFYIHAKTLCTSAGASGNLRTLGHLFWGDHSSDGDMEHMPLNDTGGLPNVTADTTSSETLDVTINYSIANAGNIFNNYMLYLYEV